MRPELAVIAAAQAGVFTRAQAFDAGYTTREIRTLTRQHGPWVVVRRGVYATRSHLRGLDPYDGRLILQDRAVHLTTPVMHVLSHDSAARTHGLAFARPSEDFVHLTRPMFTGSRAEHGVKHHRALVQPGEIETVAGMPVTALARTAVDLARAHGPRVGLSACDSAMRLGVTRAELEAELELMRSWPGVTVARTAVALADPGAENPAESLTRALLIELNLGVPETQFPVWTPAGTAWVDLRVGRLLIEFDGRVKYVERTEGGVADRHPAQVVWEEKQREDHMRAAGFGVARVVWAELIREREAARQRLRRAYATATAAYGVALSPEQLRFASAKASERDARIFRYRPRPVA